VAESRRWGAGRTLVDVSGPTHEVLNQPPPLAGHDVFTGDVALAEAAAREGAPVEPLVALGRLAGSAEAIGWGEQANANPPVLKAFDRYGHRIDEVEFHPAYHRLMSTAVAEGIHAAPWAPDAGERAHVVRAAKVIVWTQVDAGHLCPISMTYSVVPALRHEPSLASEWEPRIETRRYDPRSMPAPAKDGITCGMAMTEKQGGSDVRANTTVALADGDAWRLTGHKWFCSAPMSDAFLVLAQAPGGLSCFLLPRWTPEGARNGFFIQRLKDKVGDRSNASSEIELDDALAWMVGEEGRGVRTIIEMVQHTRLDCILGSAAGMRACVAAAAWHAAHRAAFGRVLVDQPLMANVLADLAVESEAATVSAMRLARAYDEGDALLARLATPVLKYWICKRHPALASEALECLGGNGFVEESGMPRLFRQSPLNGVWEGSGNVIALDVLRALGRSPESLDRFLAELDAALGADRRYDDAVARLRKDLSDVDPADVEPRARRLVEQMALALQAAWVVRWSPPAVADAFCASRLDGDWGRAFGTLPTSVAARPIADRATPAG
jgi:putative acyl-CoA dehydrogenase